MEATALNTLKRLAHRQTLTLTHYGRKTGKPYNVTIWFMVNGDRVFLATANRNRQWVRNVQKTPRVKLTIAGETFDANARFITDRAEHDRVLALVRQKYWMFLPVMVTGRMLMSLRLIPDNTGSFEVSFPKYCYSHSRNETTSQLDFGPTAHFLRNRSAGFREPQRTQLARRLGRQRRASHIPRPLVGPTRRRHRKRGQWFVDAP
jgi:deazaflavin-dependent oxidoreductase (nitroreductase family)